ncbi:NmrA family NAD(P)-binding protein [Arachidicoccus terrestris]|uniref:NmrA family NAD(P)-binding protein n=1 Tax=Arachidicoccus terrestris TaxID=2875539 RepID=UPI001CC82CD2|nr:NmrA family NAD(P)-binding protein [Arachidicoccus terrestris]UAY57072.1 NmrA family NAD(P)-binding protein [Arachidicoccus terrestris]
MKITVTGSLGNISRTLVRALVLDGHDVKAVTSKAEREKEIVSLGARPFIGSVEDYEFIKKAFAGSDAVYLMIPPNHQVADLKGYIKKIGIQYAQAIQETGVNYVVNLSSIGAHLENGLGPTGSNYYVESALNGLKGVHVLHLRPGMFFTNFYGAIPMIMHQYSLGNNFSGLVNIPLTHPRDIAKEAFTSLKNLSFAGKRVQYIVSDEKSGNEIARVLGKAIGRPDLNWVEFSDEQLLQALLHNGFSEQMATVYMIEIGEALREGSFMEDYNKNKSLSTGGTTLLEFSKEFAIHYHSQR